MPLFGIASLVCTVLTGGRRFYLDDVRLHVCFLHTNPASSHPFTSNRPPRSSIAAFSVRFRSGRKMFPRQPPCDTGTKLNMTVVPLSCGVPPLCIAPCRGGAPDHHST